MNFSWIEAGQAKDIASDPNPINEIFMLKPSLSSRPEPPPCNERRINSYQPWLG